jgi:predicted permease
MALHFPIPAAILRGALRRPGAFLVAMAMLSLGIGASTAVFSLMVPALLQPLGIPGESRLYEVCRRTDGPGFRLDNGMPLAELEAQQRAHAGIATLAMASWERFVVRSEGREARCLTGSFISSGYFQVMGIRPALGQGFQPGEDHLAEPAVLISHALWVNSFAAGNDALGQILYVNGQPCRVRGVLPRRFHGHSRNGSMDLWLPLGAKPAILSAEAGAGIVYSSSEPTLVRLAAGVTAHRAETAFRTVGAGFEEAARLPDTQLGPLQVRPFNAEPQPVDGKLPAPWLLLATAASLLLMAIANVVNLQLAQLEARRQEFAIRLALGGRRATIVRTVLAENLLLSLAAGGLGLALALPCMRWLQAIRTLTVYEVPMQASLDLNAFLFAMGLVLATTLGVGLIPALRASRVPLAQTLKDTAETFTRGNRLQDAMVVLQVALALALVSGASLVVRGLEQARSAPLGFRQEGVAGLRLEFPEAWPRSRRAAALNTLRERIAALPGVQAVTWAESLPMERDSQTFTTLQGKPYRRLAVGPGYFATLGPAVQRGREFQSADLAGSGRILNQALAERLWPGQDPLDRELGGSRVLAVVADHGLDPSKGIHEPVLFAPMTAEGGFRGRVCVLFRTLGAPEPLFPTIRQVLRETDPDLPLLQLLPLATHLEGLHHHLRVASWLLGFCGLAALALAAMGVQSLLAIRVVRQNREIGLRMALGAQRGRILRQVVARGMGNVAAGLVLGSLAAYWLGQACHHLFRGVDPLAFGSLLPALLTLLAVSLLACLVPALRAASLDPASAMRQE